MPKAAKDTRNHYVFEKCWSLIGRNFARVVQPDSEMHASPCNPLAKSDQTGGHTRDRICSLVFAALF